MEWGNIQWKGHRTKTEGLTRTEAEFVFLIKCQSFWSVWPFCWFPRWCTTVTWTTTSQHQQGNHCDRHKLQKNSNHEEGYELCKVGLHLISSTPSYMTHTHWRVPHSNHQSPYKKVENSLLALYWGIKCNWDKKSCKECCARKKISGTAYLLAEVWNLREIERKWRREDAHYIRQRCQAYIGELSRNRKMDNRISE
jgi:hypothetical protein